MCGKIQNIAYAQDMYSIIHFSTGAVMKQSHYGKLAGLVLASGSLLVGTVAEATDETSNLGVSSLTTNNCLFGTMTGASLTYDPIEANNNATGTDSTSAGSIVIACTDDLPYALAVGEGGHWASNSRRAQNGSSFLVYSVTQPDGTTPWGTGTTATNNEATLSSEGTGVNQTFTVNFKAVKGQNVKAGTYTDTLVVTVTY